MRAAEKEAILALRPVTFRYRKEIDPQGMLQFGLVAEEVEKMNPDLVVRDSEGKPYAVRYDAVNAMLLNEFLKQHRRVADVKSRVAQLTACLDEQDSKIQEINEQLQTTQIATKSDIRTLSASPLAALLRCKLGRQ